MNKKLYKQLCLNFNKEYNKDLFELWEEELAIFSEHEIETAIKNIIAKDKYFPTLSRIYEELNKNGFDEVSEEEKLDKYKNGIKPGWLNQRIINEPIDEETKLINEDFKSFLEDFRRN